MPLMVTSDMCFTPVLLYTASIVWFSKMRYPLWVGGYLRQIPTHLSLDPTEGPGSYRDLLFGVLLPTAPAQAYEYIQKSDESDPHPKGTEPCTGLDPSPQGHTQPLCHAMPNPATTDAKCILTCVGLTWNEAPFQIPPERTHKSDRSNA